MIQDKTPFILKAAEVFPKILRLMDVFTFGKILIGTFLIFAAIVFMTLWNERATIINQVVDANFSKMQKWEISERTEATIKTEINSHPFAAWAVITEMDLGANVKRNKFWYNEDQLFQNSLKQQIINHPNNQIFDFDKTHTEQMVKILQNEFVCSPFYEISMASYARQLNEQTQNVCRIAIPPFYGRFVGILTIGIRGPITEEVRFSIKSMASNISATVYWGDVIKLP